MAEPVRIRAHAVDGIADVTILMPHPMETGLRQDENGSLVPAHFITDVSVTVGERKVFSARMSYAVSRDPLLKFRFGGAVSGQRLHVAWTDSLGEARIDEAVIA
jgi:sulfur-oxidizing protein SoxZ